MNKEGNKAILIEDMDIVKLTTYVQKVLRREVEGQEGVSQ